jgi:hypothetical protein
MPGIKIPPVEVNVWKPRGYERRAITVEVMKSTPESGIL